MIDFNIINYYYYYYYILSINLTLRASPSNSALSRERGMPFAAENRKLSHVHRKKSNLTQLHRNFKTAEPIYVCRTISQENKSKCKSSSKIYIQRKSNCKSWSIFNCKSWSINNLRLWCQTSFVYGSIFD